MKTYAEQAELHRILLRAEVLSVEDVIHWADSVIVSIDKPDAELSDLCLSSDCEQQEIEVQLQNMADGCSKLVPIRLAIPIIFAARGWMDELPTSMVLGESYEDLWPLWQLKEASQSTDSGDGDGGIAKAIESLSMILEGHRLWLERSNGGIYADLCGANLTGVDICAADLSNALLFGADLRDADLRGVNLRRTILLGADLRGANLISADLSFADLRGAILLEADLCDANLYRADLRKADLRKALLLRTFFREANLYEADLRGADLRKADMSKSNYRVAQYNWEELRHAINLL